LAVADRIIAVSLMPSLFAPRARRVVLSAMMLVVLSISGSCRSLLTVKYEYDEDVQLAIDGSAIVHVNASVPALVALRGAPLDVNPRARLDRNDVRAFFASPVASVASITTSRRDNRRYVHVRLDVPDVRRLHEAQAFAWSQYGFTKDDRLAVFKQDVGTSAARTVGDVGWQGDELVAFRLHLPSRVTFHNSSTREVERGNIIRWEQGLSDRLKGQPVAIEVQMEAQSILFQTLMLFGVTAVLAVATMGLAVWWVMRRGGASKEELKNEELRTKNVVLRS
jgi:hypothetical protein